MPTIASRNFVDFRSGCWKARNRNGFRASRERRSQFLMVNGLLLNLRDAKNLTQAGQVSRGYSLRIIVEPRKLLSFLALKDELHVRLPPPVLQIGINVSRAFEHKTKSI